MPPSHRSPRGPGAARLARSLAALQRLAMARPAPLAPDHPQPATAWEMATEARLSAIEQQISNQNRLLLLTLVSVVTDVVLGLAR